MLTFSKHILDQIWLSYMYHLGKSFVAENEYHSFSSTLVITIIRASILSRAWTVFAASGIENDVWGQSAQFKLEAIEYKLAHTYTERHGLDGSHNSRIKAFHPQSDRLDNTIFGFYYASRHNIPRHSQELGGTLWWPNLLHGLRSSRRV